MAEWSRVINTTIRDYSRKVWENTLRNRKLWALLKSKGRMTFNHEGEQMEWRVVKNRIAMSAYGDMETISFTRKDQFIRANLDWRGYQINDAMSLKEQHMNKGKAAVIKYYEQMTPLLTKAMQEQLGEELYVDGNAAGNTKKFHGIESFMGNSGASSGGFIATPSDTYAGLSTVLGNYGGSWTGDWPEGTGDATQSYDFWSPLIVDYTDGDWSGSTDTWANRCVEQMRFAILYSQKNAAAEGQSDLIVLNDRMYREFLGKLESLEQINVMHGKQDSPLVGLGYRDVIPLDGVDVTWEYGLNATSGGGANDVGVGYLFNSSNMEVCFITPDVFNVKGPIFSEDTLSLRTVIYTFGNIKWNPRQFAKFLQVT